MLNLGDHEPIRNTMTAESSVFILSFYLNEMVT